ncbi:MAG: hypothetical protein P1R58_07980 [bacterium]|nr:hypothetical protein [bacterium]
MKEVRRLAVLSVLALVIAIFGCGTQEKTDSTSEKNSGSAEKPLLTERDSVEDLLNEALIRLSYGDKSGLYDLEFEYLQDEFDFDQYLKKRELQWARMDTLDHLELTELIHEGEDSALAKIVYVFKGPTGKINQVPDQFYIYKQYDEWKKPTSSLFSEQKKYEELMRQAREAAAEDEG